MNGRTGHSPTDECVMINFFAGEWRVEMLKHLIPPPGWLRKYLTLSAGVDLRGRSL